MKKEEAKKLLREKYIIWKQQQEKITSNSKYNFYWYIHKNKPHLLGFKHSGRDQTQIVYCMLSGL